MTQILKGAMILSTKTSRIRDPRRPGGPPQAGKLALGGAASMNLRGRRQLIQTICE